MKREDAGTRDVQTEMKELGPVWANLWIATFVQHPLEGHQLTRRSNPRIVEDGSACRSQLDGPLLPLGKLDDQRKHWVGEYPTQALGNRQVAPHERCRAQRGRSEALAKRVFTILNWGVMISRHLVIAHLVTSIALPLRQVKLQSEESNEQHHASGNARLGSDKQ